MKHFFFIKSLQFKICQKMTDLYLIHLFIYCYFFLVLLLLFTFVSFTSSWVTVAFLLFSIAATIFLVLHLLVNTITTVEATTKQIVQMIIVKLDGFKIKEEYWLNENG